MDKKNKVILIITLFVIGLIVLPWFIFPVLNNLKADMLKNELQNEHLPEKTKIVEALSGCGNTGGTGDHTEVWAGILIKTELSESEIIEFYGNNAHKVDEHNTVTSAMGLLDKEFANLKGITDFEGYYIVERIDDAVSSYFDLRGC